MQIRASNSAAPGRWSSSSAIAPGPHTRPLPTTGRMAKTIVTTPQKTALGRRTIIGTGLTAAAQGLLVGVGFWLVHLAHAVFWGVVTMLFAMFPVVGSGLVL